MIGYFKILEKVLTNMMTNYVRTTQIPEADCIEIVKEQLDYLHSEYYKLDREKPICYDEPMCRFAYLFTYVCAHASMTEHAFRVFPAIGEEIVRFFTSSDKYRICALGGGPGSELLGIVKFVESKLGPNDYIRLDFKLVDYVKFWQDSWQQLKDNVDKHLRVNYGDDYRNWRIHIESAALVLDLLRIEDFRTVDVFSDVNLVIFNHVISELINSMKEFEEIFDVMVDSCPPGTKFLFIDIDQERVREALRRLLAEKTKLNGLGNWNGTFQVDHSEQKTDLGNWPKLLNNSPRLTCKAFYTVCQKNDR